MTRLLALLLAFAAAPAALAASGVLPPVVGPTGVLMVAGLGLSGLAGRVVFHRLSVALLTGAVSGGIAAWCNAQLGWPGSVDALAGGVALVAAGIGGGFLAHALVFAFTGTRGFDQGFRPARSMAPYGASSRPWVGVTGFVHARHPARLKAAYCRFHVAATWTFAAAWLALLGLLLWFGQRQGALSTIDLPGAAAMPSGWLMWAGGALLTLAATAVAGWWLVAGLLAAIAVAAGALPPFGLGSYVRSGHFPSHWIAHEHADRSDDADQPADD